MNDGKYLQNINSPEDLKKLPLSALPELCEEIRGFLIDNISKNGGHLSSNLGVVEITVGLHRVFDSPRDHIIFDVGHQSYTHKILTGRKEMFESLRKKDGLSGFMNPKESIHDPCVTGHASNSVSAALGYARADKLKGEKSYSVCVIGDGALTGGMAYEALNDAGRSKLPLIVILNDNEMSISRNVGAMANWFSNLRLKSGYLNLKSNTRDFLRHFGSLGGFLTGVISKAKNSFKGKVLPDNIFRVLGFEYLGPSDGNDTEQVISLLNEAKRLDKPVVVHFITQKGRGYRFSENDPSVFHGVNPFNSKSGKVKEEGGVSFSSVFGDILVKLAKKDTKICAITAAMEMGTGLSSFKQVYPHRFYDVGIAEEHAVAMAAAMSENGVTPVCAIYSTFLQRAYDQLQHDVSLNGNHVVFAIDRSGPVGADGPTHHGIYDVPYLRSVPGMAIYAPSSYKELYSAITKAVYEEKGPVAVKYPKGKEGAFSDDTFEKDAVVLKSGESVTLVSYGVLINNLISAADTLGECGVSAEVVKLNRLDKPDINTVIESVKKTKRMIVIEDCIEPGSVGEMLSAICAENGVCADIELCNFKNCHGGIGTCDELFDEHGISTQKIIETVRGKIFRE